jgi:hypothetical protein
VPVGEQDKIGFDLVDRDGRRRVMRFEKRVDHQLVAVYLNPQTGMAVVCNVKSH